MTADPERPTGLFLCTGNSARSRMAGAVLRDPAGDRFNAASAGLVPKVINALTPRVLEEAGLSTSSLHSKPSSQVLGKVSAR
ncbi:MAG: hypothetical protein JNK53_03395 [Phycisphaerae bacterium]|nr:hypothetical protein [Phycisphaerae bacterium]